MCSLNDQQNGYGSTIIITYSILVFTRFIKDSDCGANINKGLDGIKDLITFEFQNNEILKYEFEQSLNKWEWFLTSHMEKFVMNLFLFFVNVDNFIKQIIKIHRKNMSSKITKNYASNANKIINNINKCLIHEFDMKYLEIGDTHYNMLGFHIHEKKRVDRICYILKKSENPKLKNIFIRQRMSLSQTRTLRTLDETDDEIKEQKDDKVEMDDTEILATFDATTKNVRLNENLTIAKHKYDQYVATVFLNTKISKKDYKGCKEYILKIRINKINKKHPKGMIIGIIEEKENENLNIQQFEQQPFGFCHVKTAYGYLADGHLLHKKQKKLFDKNEENEKKVNLPPTVEEELIQKGEFISVSYKNYDYDTAQIIALKYGRTSFGSSTRCFGNLNGIYVRWLGRHKGYDEFIDKNDLTSSTIHGRVYPYKEGDIVSLKIVFDHKNKKENDLCFAVNKGKFRKAYKLQYNRSYRPVISSSLKRNQFEIISCDKVPL